MLIHLLSAIAFLFAAVNWGRKGWANILCILVMTTLAVFNAALSADFVKALIQ